MTIKFADIEVNDEVSDTRKKDFEKVLESEDFVLEDGEVFDLKGKETDSVVKFFESVGEGLKSVWDILRGEKTL